VTFIYPDLNWYTGISKAESVPPRCPYANVHRCPRHYHSLYLMGESGITTKMKPEKIKQLDTFWRKTDILPVVSEHHTGISGYGDKKSGFSNFCPEISFDVFGLFADHLHRYSDEIDADVAHSRLAKEAHPQDWCWQWASVSPLHYLNCPLYSQLISRPHVTSREDIDLPAPAEMVEVKPGFMGINLNLKAVLTRVARWWLAKQTK
jgi:hypothetical protein